MILRLAVQHEAIVDNPVRHLDPIEGGSRKPRALTAEERRRFLAWMLQGTSENKDEARMPASSRRRDLPDIVTLMLGTGVRIGEALAMRWCDVDLVGVPVADGDTLRAVPIVAITGNVVRHRGGGLHRHSGKTESSLRIVPLPRFVVKMLQGRDVHGAEAPVFPAASRNGDGLNWKDPNNMATYIREARQAAGMEWPVTSHTFRKTAATIWHDSGVLTDRQKADLTGHAKISTLTDIYVARGELHPQGAAVMDAAWQDS